MQRSQVGLREREQLYRLMISQLFYDGHQGLAVSLANLTQAHPSCPPSERLLMVVALGLKAEEAQQQQVSQQRYDVDDDDVVLPGTGVDLEFETDVQTISPEAVHYETCYVTAHKAPCRCAAFTNNGQLVATGSEDASIKILDVERMLAKSIVPGDGMSQETPQQQMENHPVIRTLYDHTAEITCVDFHPTQQILASGSLDLTVKLFEYSKPSVKKAYKSIQEAAEVQCLSFHPSGDCLVVGTTHPTLRVYDVNTFQCFVSCNPTDQHNGPITSVKYSPNANMYVSASADGDIKLWDGVSGHCINTFSAAHSGREVSSVLFSRNSKYVLSSGRDSVVKLWELSTSRCLIAYTGAGVITEQEQRAPAVFNHTEDYVFFPDEKTISLCCWDSRNADRQRLLSLGHNAVVRSIAHSPVTPAFVSCSDDFRARFWFRKAETD